MSPLEIAALHVTRATPIREVIEVIDRSARLSLALLVDDGGRLEATITDGDVRRAIMHGLSLDAPTQTMLPIKARLPHPDPVTAPLGTDPATQLALMQERRVRQLPLVDPDGRVVDITLLTDLLPQEPQQMQAVIMAGGLGTRLRPLTDDLPKPMLPIGGKPLLEHIVGRLHDSGISQIVVTTHYLPQKIVEHFGDGHEFDVALEYVNEDQPLGTGGALGLIPRPSETLLVMNGDVLTSVDFEAMLAYHHEQDADLTLGVRRYGFQVPYGVVECDGGPQVLAVNEKPELSFFVNAGIYLLEPVVWSHVGEGTRLNMTDLIGRVIAAGLDVVSFPVLEYWMDIGRNEDYARAQFDVDAGQETDAPSNGDPTSHEG